MKRDKILGIFIVMALIIGAVTPIITTVMAQPPEPHGVYGRVNANTTYGVGAYDADPAKNGQVTAYIQNRSDEGPDYDVMKYDPPAIPFDHFWNRIEDNIPDWADGDPCVVIVDFEDGEYLTNDRAGYVTYERDILDDTVSDQQYNDTELKKVPVPQFTINGSSFINFSWTPLDDPLGLIAGYTVYRSDTNATDPSWGQVSGDKDSPVTNMYYNDTGVASGSMYYYALKVSFAGSPGNIESRYYGEGSSLMESKVSSLVTDSLVIEFVGTGIVVGTETINILESVGPVVAQGYNITSGLATGAVDCTWSVNDTFLGGCNPPSGTQSTFDASDLGGWVLVTADNLLGLSDTFNVIIRFPTVDYIVLTYTNGTEIIDFTDWNIGDPLDIEARGYNDTASVITYVGLVNVDWSIVSGGGSIVPGSGTTTTYTTGVIQETVQIMGDSPGLGLSDTVILDIDWLTPPTIDEMRLVDSGGNEITDPLVIGGQIEVFAGGFNSSSGGLVGFVLVDWDVTPGGNIDVLSGYSTNLTAGFAGGAVTIYGNDTLIDELTITITPPGVDYINITDSADGVDLISELISTVGSVTAYASGYNNTGNTYVGLVTVTWTVNQTGLGTFSATSADTTIFTGSDSGVGTVLITADDGSGHTDNFTIELKTFTVDSIEITDAADGVILDSVGLDVGADITLFASGYNITGGYTGLVVADWTQATDIGDFSAASGTSTIYTAGLAGDSTSIVATSGTMTDKIPLTINPPTVDSIQIKNASDDGGIEVTSDTFTLGEVVTMSYYCTAYNDTSGYIPDISAAWTLDVVVGTVNPVAGTFTLFTATTEGTAILMANVSGTTDTITITVEPELDTTAPAAPTGVTVAAGTVAGTLVITWTANTEADLAGYFIYGADSATGPFTKLNSVRLTDTTYTDTGLGDEVTRYYRITAEDAVPNVSGNSTTASGTTAAAVPDGDDDDDDDGEFPMILLLLPIIIIVVLLLLFLMMKKKKPEEAAPPEEEEKELPPPPGAKEEVEEVEAVEEEEDVPPPEDEPVEEEGEEIPEDDEEKPPEE